MNFELIKSSKGKDILLLDEYLYYCNQKPKVKVAVAATGTNTTEAAGTITTEAAGTNTTEAAGTNTTEVAAGTNTTEAAVATNKTEAATYWRCIYYQYGFLFIFFFESYFFRNLFFTAIGADGSSETLCPARANSRDGVATNTKAHNHAPCPRVVEMLRLHGIIKEAAKSQPLLAPRKVMAEALQKTPAAIRPLLDTENTGRNIRRIRKQLKKAPANPKTLKDLIIPEDKALMGTENIIKYDGWVAANVVAGGRWQLADGGRGGGGLEESDPEVDENDDKSSRIIIISTDHLLDCLADSRKR
jgi:hypothetical protein